MSVGTQKTVFYYLLMVAGFTTCQAPDTSLAAPNTKHSDIATLSIMLLEQASSTQLFFFCGNHSLVHGLN
jgi:hypothetical protein